MRDQATNLPWIVITTSDAVTIMDTEGLQVIAFPSTPQDEREAYAIVAAVNERDALIAQNRAMREALELALEKLEAMREHFKGKWPLDLSPVTAETAIKAVLAHMEGQDSWPA